MKSSQISVAYPEIYDQVWDRFYLVHDTIRDELNEVDKDKKDDFLEMVPHIVLVGSGAIGKLKNWINKEEDMDLFYFEYDKKARYRNSDKLYSLIPGYIEQDFKLDLLSDLTTDDFTNSDGITLTQYVFGDKGDYYTEKLGRARMINFYGFFITKLAAVCKRDETRDYMALDLMMKEFNG